jgi:16S rRNA G966 N2-methylase RsmD
MAAFIQKTAAELKIPLTLVKAEVFKFISQCDEQFDFIFAGPPYALTEIDNIPSAIFTKGLLREGGWFVLEHTPRNQYKDHPYFKAERHYGTTVFSIFIHTVSNAEKTAP